MKQSLIEQNTSCQLKAVKTVEVLPLVSDALSKALQISLDWFCSLYFRIV